MAWLAGGTAMALWTLRRLGLPFWWIFWAPVFEAVWTANPNTLVIALLVAGGSTSGVVAVLTKVYAAVPLFLLGRWRPLVWTAIVIAVTRPSSRGLSSSMVV